MEPHTGTAPVSSHWQCDIISYYTNEANHSNFGAQCGYRARYYDLEGRRVSVNTY